MVHTRLCGIYHTAAAGQWGHHAKRCSLTPHVLRGTPRLSVIAIVVVVVREQRGLPVLRAAVLVLVLVLATPPLAASRFAAPARPK